MANENQIGDRTEGAQYDETDRCTTKLEQLSTSNGKGLADKKNGEDSGNVKKTTKVTANGDVKSPMKIPNLKKEPSYMRTPTKGLSPKSPEGSVVGGEKKKLPMNKVQVGSAPSPNLKVVRSKIGSLENSSYKPGGGKVKIENRKLEWKAQPRIEAKNDCYTPKGGDKKIQHTKLHWSAKSKIGSLENATHKPGGGDKKIESVKLVFKDKAKPKVGSKDNIKHVPGGGAVKTSIDGDRKSVSSDIEEQKIDIKAKSKVGSLDNVKHKPGGGDKKIFEDKEYLKQVSEGAKTQGEAEAVPKVEDEKTIKGTPIKDKKPDTVGKVQKMGAKPTELTKPSFPPVSVSEKLTRRFEPEKIQMTEPDKEPAKKELSETRPMKIEEKRETDFSKLEDKEMENAPQKKEPKTDDDDLQKIEVKEISTVKSPEYKEGGISVDVSLKISPEKVADKEVVSVLEKLESDVLQKSKEAEKEEETVAALQNIGNGNGVVPDIILEAEASSKEAEVEYISEKIDGGIEIVNKGESIPLEAEDEEVAEKIGFPDSGKEQSETKELTSPQKSEIKEDFGFPQETKIEESVVPKKAEDKHDTVPQTVEVKALDVFPPKIVTEEGGCVAQKIETGKLDVIPQNAAEKKMDTVLGATKQDNIDVHGAAHQEYGIISQKIDNGAVPLMSKSQDIQGIEEVTECSQKIEPKQEAHEKVKMEHDRDVTGQKVGEIPDEETIGVIKVDAKESTGATQSVEQENLIEKSESDKESTGATQSVEQENLIEKPESDLDKEKFTEGTEHSEQAGSASTPLIVPPISTYVKPEDEHK